MVLRTRFNPRLLWAGIIVSQPNYLLILRGQPGNNRAIQSFTPARLGAQLNLTQLYWIDAGTQAYPIGPTGHRILGPLELYIFLPGEADV